MGRSSYHAALSSCLAASVSSRSRAILTRCFPLYLAAAFAAHTRLVECHLGRQLRLEPREVAERLGRGVGASNALKGLADAVVFCHCAISGPGVVRLCERALVAWLTGAASESASSAHQVFARLPWDPCCVTVLV